MSLAALIDSITMCMRVCVGGCGCNCVCVGVIVWVKVGVCGCGSLH